MLRGFGRGETLVITAGGSKAVVITAGHIRQKYDIL